MFHLRMRSSNMNDTNGFVGEREVHNGCIFAFQDWVKCLHAHTQSLYSLMCLRKHFLLSQCRFCVVLWLEFPTTSMNWILYNIDEPHKCINLFVQQKNKLTKKTKTKNKRHSTAQYLKKNVVGFCLGQLECIALDAFATVTAECDDIWMCVIFKWAFYILFLFSQTCIILVLFMQHVFICFYFSMKNK